MYSRKKIKCLTNLCQPSRRWKESHFSINKTTEKPASLKETKNSSFENAQTFSTQRHNVERHLAPKSLSLSLTHGITMFIYSYSFPPEQPSTPSQLLYTDDVIRLPPTCNIIVYCFNFYSCLVLYCCPIARINRQFVSCWRAVWHDKFKLQKCSSWHLLFSWVSVLFLDGKYSESNQPSGMCCQGKTCQKYPLHKSLYPLMSERPVLYLTYIWAEAAVVEFRIEWRERLLYVSAVSEKYNIDYI